MAVAKQHFVKPAAMPMGDHVYEGVHFPTLVRSTTLDALKTWQVRPDDIFCVTYPKSGTHWIFEIVNLILTGGEKSKIDHISRMAMLPELSRVKSPNDTSSDVGPVGYELLDSWKSPRVIVTHLPEQFFPSDALKKKVKIIYLARNPKDVLCSYASFGHSLLPAELQDFDNFIKYNLLSDEVMMGTWFEHILGYAKHHNDDNFLFVKYEDLHKDIVSQVKRIATFLDRPLTNEIAERVAFSSTIKEMKDSYKKYEEEDPEGKTRTRAFGELSFLNKGKVGSWKEQITGDLNELFDNVYKEKMANSDIQLDFEI